MKPITINVSTESYKALQAYARKKDRTTSELIREAMDDYLQTHVESKPSLSEFRPARVGKVLRPLISRAGLFEEMLDEE